MAAAMEYNSPEYEAVIKGMLPYVGQIKQDLALHEALAQASLMTSEAAKRRIQAKHLQLMRPEEYVPPKEVLLYLVRMGSFNSAPKIMNEDTQDDKLQLPSMMTHHELLDFCHKEKTNSSQLLKRFFLQNNVPLSESFKHMSINDTKKKSNGNSFRVLQWNVLSQTLGQSNDSFVKCPEDALTWDSRKYNMIEEIIQYEPDLICLQEVDHFNFLSKILSTQGYEGLFYPKPDSPCMYVEGNNGPDGCAVFYKKELFKCVSSDTRILQVWKIHSNQVAILVVLHCIKTGKEICVATTHLKAKNGALLSKLRDEQGRDLLEFINTKSENRPVIVCGDFNAEPTEPVYKTMISDKHLGLSSAYANFSMQKDNTDTYDPDLSISHEAPYTTWKVREEGEICHTIDYIFFSQRHLKVDSILQVPSAEDLGEGRVPSYTYPSDHFSLVCDFSLVFSEKKC